MLQKEVVDRMAAAPGNKDYGRLSVMLQWRYEMENVLFVPPEAFDPPPRVDSAVVRMVPLRRRRAAVDAALLRELVQVAFSSAASSCATRSAAGWTSAASPAASTCSAAPRRCRSQEYVALASRSPPPYRNRRTVDRKQPGYPGLPGLFSAARESPSRSTGVCFERLRRRQPIARVEGAAHAQRQGRDVDQLVGGHLFAVVGDAVRRGAAARPVSLVRPFCLAGVCRTGYRKE